MTQYPGPDPDDPFSRPPNEQGENPPAAPPPAQPDHPGMDETAPIQGEEMGYWERQAQGDDQAPSQEPPTEQPPGQPRPPLQENPWAGYGAPAPTPPYQQGYGQQGNEQPGYAQPAYGQSGYPAYGYAAQPPKHPQSTTALVLGLVSVIGGCLCGLPLLVAPFAWVVGAKTKREIAASNGQLGGEGNAQAGFVMGIIGTVLLVLAVVAVVLVIVAGLATDSGSGSTQF
ncbi:MAG: hypothetical protein ABI873_01050 [Marmoricola sp.]